MVVLSSGRMLPGSARGVRVWASTWSALTGTLSIFVFLLLLNTPGSGWLTFLPIIPFALSMYVATRCWSLGMYVTGQTFHCRNWIRTFEVQIENVSAIELWDVTTMLTGSMVSWVPFAGRVRMIVIVYDKNGRTRRYMATSVYGRYRTIRTVADEMRKIAGLAPPYFDT
ncbi:hypothetical protein [Microbacterium binotii]|uniref:hypothetical protein n=1 Tax=Microbacterium binotii TaxID=462710 RepID=UPI001F39F9FB|nr:hypothetical protein [Microbacterium binotii]UIN30346.1 hypothetical protein LXM64_14570 [Microbacterium binotii]